MTVDSYQLASTLRRFQARAPQRQRNLYRMSRGEVLSVDTPARVRLWLARRGVPAPEADRLIAQGSGARVAAVESVGAREPDALERVIGTSDLMGVAFLERGLDVARTVARVWVSLGAGSPSAYGTGFLISPRLLMTNFHVLGDAPAASTSKAEFNYQLGADGNPSPPALFALDPGTFFVADRDLDYAVVAVAEMTAAGAQLSDFGFNAMLQEQGKAIAAQWLNVIQHPGGGYKQLALRENRLVDVFDDFLTYQTDTAPGSSGSPVYNDRWEVVGLHHSGVMAKDAQGRTLAIDGRVWTEDMGEGRVKWIANEGIRISSIIADLKSKASAPAQRRLIDEMLTQAPPATGPRERRTAPSGDPPRAQIAPDGSATWTIPLTVTVSLPGRGAVQPPSGVPVDADDLGNVLGQAQAVFGARHDVLAVRLGYVFKNGWITKERAIVVKVRRRMAPADLREAGVAPIGPMFRGLPVEVINPSIDDLMLMHAGTTAAEAFGQTAVDAEEIVYQPPAGAKLPEFSEQMKVTACVSPDHGWPMLKAFLGATRNHLVVGMYDFGAGHIAEAIEALGAKSSFKKMTLAIQGGSAEGGGTKADDLPDEQMVERLRKALGTKFESAWIKIGIKSGWVATSYHIKVAVRDGAAVWLSSGNWQSSNQPNADPLHENPPTRSWLTKYNRDWHVAIEHPKLAAVFDTYLRNDFARNKDLGGPEKIATPDILLPRAAFRESPEEAAAPFKYFAPFAANRKFTVGPLLTPDNFKEALLKLVRDAEHQLLIQNQTFNAATGQQKELGRLLDAIVERQTAGVDIRIIFRVVDATKARENLEALQDRGFDMQRVKVQRNCHTKGVIADREHVLIGSQNLSQLGITLNRDASLLFRNDAELAAYFAAIFEHDWANLARQTIGSEAHAPELVLPGEATPTGMERLSWKTYWETV